MRGAKQKTDINAEKSQIERVKQLIDSGRYRTVSEFVREALEEKPEGVTDSRIAEAVERYCAAGHDKEDIDLISVQAFGPKLRAPTRKGRHHAAR